MQQQLPAATLQPDQYHWLQLTAITGLGPVTLKKLWQHFGSATAILDATASQLRPLGVRASVLLELSRRNSNVPSSFDQTSFVTIEHWLQQPLHHLLSLDDPRYPTALKQIADPPPLLYLIGDPQLLGLPQIALVGSRNGSAQGLENARGYACYLSNAGLVPVSGLALGIDAAAHQGALQGLGLTVAVLGTGVDWIYPARHQQLAQKIVEQGGLLVSELPLSTPPRAQQFPKRNRIISALSLGVLVVEAALRSGSLITARQALEQGREVFALPGSIHNPVSRGCHELIRQGALLVDSADQILQELAPMLADASLSSALTTSIQSSEECPVSAPITTLTADEQQLLTVLGFDPISLDQLVSRSGFPVAKLQAKLLQLELQGWLCSVPGGYQRIQTIKD